MWGRGSRNTRPLALQKWQGGSGKKALQRDFPGGPVVKNLPSNAGDMRSTPGQGTKIPHASEQLSPRATTTEPACPRACELRSRGSQINEIEKKTNKALQREDAPKHSAMAMCTQLFSPNPVNNNREESKKGSILLTGDQKRSKQQTRDFNNFWKDRKPNDQRGGSSREVSYTTHRHLQAPGTTEAGTRCRMERWAESLNLAVGAWLPLPAAICSPKGPHLPSLF